MFDRLAKQSAEQTRKEETARKFSIMTQNVPSVVHPCHAIRLDLLI
jgi:hypothetical protein